MINLTPSERNTCYDVLKNALVGHLGLLDTAKYPRVIPLNFVFLNEHIYFHGGTYGEKYFLINRAPKVTFSVEVPYSLIPSYWVNPERGCSITQFFKSVLIRGRAKLIEMQEEEIFVLHALMDKYQPEGGYEPFVLDSHVYGKAFEKVATFSIHIEAISIKNYFGQRLTSPKLDQLLYKLQERNTALDRATILEIKKCRSDHTA